jgi:hypothetical protein
VDGDCRAIPVRFKSKKPARTDWQKLRPTADELPALFGTAPTNIGILNGAPSNGLIDIDLDCPEAVRAAPLFLPETALISGHKSSPYSHYFFRVADPPRKASLKLWDVIDQCLIELRSSHSMTVVPPSLHKGTGEPIRWYEEGEPAAVDLGDLRRAFHRTAAAALLAQVTGPGPASCASSRTRSAPCRREVPFFASHAAQYLR